MTLKEIGQTLEKYRKIELEIDLLRQQQSDIQKYIHDTKESDEQIAKVKANAEDALVTEQADYDDVSGFLNSVIDSKHGKNFHNPKLTHQVHDEFFTNPYENYSSYKKVLWRITVVFAVCCAVIAVLVALFVELDYVKWPIVGVLVLIPFVAFFLFRKSFVSGIRKLSISQLEAMQEKHDIIVSKVKEEATEKIDRIKYQIEQEYEKKSEEKLKDQEVLNNKILALRKENSELGIPINVMQMYDSLMYRDLFVSLLKNAEPNDTLIGIWGSLKLQEELYKLNSQMYETAILLGKKEN